LSALKEPGASKQDDRSALDVEPQQVGPVGSGRLDDVNTPPGFWGGRVIDPKTWQPRETFDGPLLWGHERLYMPDEQRKRLREMRLSARTRGSRAGP
jgi:hypothetical protein